MPLSSEQIEVLELLVAEIDASMAKLDEKLATFQAERKGLELALTRLRGEMAPRPESATPTASTPTQHVYPQVFRPWESLKRTDAILRVLAESKQPMGRQEVTRALAEQGRKDKVDDVSAALAYLLRQQKVVKVFGGWALVDDGEAVAPS
jgi:hypothetical protein